jgi:hypothetical protein
MRIPLLTVCLSLGLLALFCFVSFGIIEEGVV